MSDCLHEPKARPGRVCECEECRRSRSRALRFVMSECVRCAGSIGVDKDGQLTCAANKHDCPVLDLWHCVHNREIDPAAVTPAMVELTHKGRLVPPKAYPRVDPSQPWTRGKIRSPQSEGQSASATSVETEPETAPKRRRAKRRA